MYYANGTINHHQEHGVISAAFGYIPFRQVHSKDWQCGGDAKAHIRVAKQYTASQALLAGARYDDWHRLIRSGCGLLSVSE